MSKLTIFAWALKGVQKAPHEVSINHQKIHQIIRFCRYFRVEESRQKRILPYDSSLSTYDINFISFSYRFNLLKKRTPEVPFLLIP